MFTSLSANLSEDALKDIQRLEKEIGHPILAFSYYDLKPANLKPGQVSRIQEYEKGRCIALMAVEGEL